MSPKVLIIYDTITGNTEKLAKAISEGIKQVPNIIVDLKRTEEVTNQEVIEADGYAIGSPSHFSIMSGKILSLLTRLYVFRHDMIGKPMAVFTTGTGGQVITLENIDRIIGVFNPAFIKPGMVMETAHGRSNPWEIDEARAKALGKKLGNEVDKQSKKQ